MHVEPVITTAIGSGFGSILLTELLHITSQECSGCLIGWTCAATAILIVCLCNIPLFGKNRVDGAPIVFGLGAVVPFLVQGMIFLF